MTIDANIIIAYLAGDRKVVEAVSGWRREGRVLFLPSVVETEVLSFSEWIDDELIITEKFIYENFTSVSFDRNIARIAAGIRRETKLKFPDAAIAATAIFLQTPLVTRNIKDFKKVPRLEILAL